MARIAKFKKYTGKFPHREHRSKKGRKGYNQDEMSKRFKRIKEKLRVGDLSKS